MIFILDRNENVINILRNNGGVSDTPPIFNDVHSEDLSTGAEIFSFSTLGQGSISSDLSIGNYVAFKKNGKFKLFQIMESEERHEQEKVIEVYCESAGLELINKVFRKRTMKGVNLRQFLKTVLDETGWLVGRISGTSEKVLDFEIDDESVYSVLQNNLNKYDVEFEFRVEIKNNRIVGKYIDTYAHRGMVTGKRFSFGRDIEGITRKRSGTELYTALIGRGKDGLTFKDVTVDGIDKPLGQDFVADQEAYNRYNHNGYHIMGVFDYDTDNAGELLRETYRRLQKVKDVKVEYEVKVALLSDLLKEEWNDVQIGDTVTIVDHAFNPPIQLAARVSKLDTSFTDPSVNACTLSNFIELKSNITNDMRKIAAQLEGYVDSQFPIGGDKIQNGAISQEQMNERYVATLTTDILEAGKVVTNELIAENAKIVNAEIESLKANDAKIENAVIENLEATNAEIEFLKVKDAEIEKVVAEKVTTEELEAMEAKIGSAIIGSAEILDAKINILEADFAEIDTLLAGNITADNIKADSITADKIQTGTITAGSGVIANGAIGNAQISNIDAGKISAGKIDTSKVEVVGADGHLKIKGNRLQVFQGTGKDAKERVSIGDVNNDGTVYGLRVRGADGETILLDENGVTQEGITDGSITNDKISGEANIDGSKININSVVTRINEDGTEVIKGNKIDVDGTNLSVKLSTITDKQDENSNRITQNSSRIDATEESIALKVDSQSYMEEVNKINNNISSINTNLAKNTTSIELLKDSITSKVSQTEVNEIVENKVGNIQIGGRNLILDSTTPVINPNWSSNGWAGNITAHSDKTYKLVANNGWRVHKYKLPTEYAGKTITISFYAKLLSNETTSTMQNGLYVSNSTGTNPYITSNFETIGNTGSNDLPVKDTWIYYYATVVLNSDCQIGIALRCSPESQNLKTTWLVKELKVEEGNKATSWSPAPEDVNASISTVDSKVTNISNKTSTLEQNLNSISGRITSTETTMSTIESKIDNMQIGGRNLLTRDCLEKGNLSGGDGSILDGNYTNFYRTKDFIDIDNTSKYILKINKVSLGGKIEKIISYTSTKAYISTQEIHSMEKIFIPPTNCTKIKFVVIVDNMSTPFVAEEIKIKLEKGNKATDWTPAPEDIDASIDNIQIGGRNLLVGTATPKSANFNCPTGYSTFDPYTTYSKKTLADLGFKSGDEVTISFDWKISKNGTLDEVYGNFRLEWKGIDSTGTNDKYVGLIKLPVDTFSSSNKSGHVVIVTKLDTNSVKAHTLRFRIDNSVLAFTVSNVMVEKGNKASSWTPAPEDIQADINKKANSTDVYKKTETYSKTETDSAIKVAKDNITLSVSNTYETKANVESKISTAVNNVQIGGRNLISKSKVSQNSSTATFDSATNTWTINATAGAGGIWGCGLVITGTDVRIPFGSPYVLSFEIKVPRACSWNSDVNCYPVSGNNWSGNDNDVTDKRKFSSKTISANDVNKWVKCWIYFENTNYGNTNKVDLYDNTNFGVVMKDETSNMTYQIRNIKGELGNKPTDWSPAPVDIQADINKKANSVDVYKKTETYNRTETDAKIKTTNDSITSSVSKLQTNIDKVQWASAQNLLYNSDFLKIVNGFPHEWTRSNSSIVTMNDGWLFEGAKAIKISATGLTADVYDAAFSPFVKVNAGQVVTASVYSNSTTWSTCDYGAHLQIEFWNDKDRLEWHTVSIKPSDNSAGWKRYSKTNTAPSGTTRVRVRFHNQRNGTFYIAKPMLQFGSTLTGWSRGGDLTTLTERVATAESKITNDAIINTVTSSSYWKQTSNAVNQMTQGTRCHKLGAKINYSEFGVSNQGEIYLHGYNSNNEPADVNGSIIFSGVTHTLVKGMVNPNADFGLGVDVYLFKNPNTSHNATYGAYYDTSSNTWKWRGLVGATGSGNISMNEGYIAFGQFNMKDAETFNYATLYNEPVLLKNCVSYKEEVSGQYATKSSLTQTTNSIIAKFEASGGYNLFKNSGFLTGDMTHWGLQQHNSPTASWSLISHSNTWGFPDSSVKTFQIKMSNQTNKEYGLSQTINTTIGKKYTISFYCAAHRANNANIIVRQSGSGSWLSNKYFNPQDSTKNGGNTSVDKWLYVTHTFTATGNSHAINLVLVNAQSDGYFWIAKPQVVEGEAPLSYSPNPSEVYSGNTVIDARGVTVTNGGFKVKNTSNKDVFWVDSNGQATVDNLQVYGNGASTINVYGNGHKHLKFESWTSHGAQISFNQLTGQSTLLVGRMITYPDQGANLYIEADSNIIVRSTRSSTSANVECPLKVVGQVYGTAFRHWGDKFELYHDGADLRLKNKKTDKSVHLSDNGNLYYDNKHVIVNHKLNNVHGICRANGYLEIATDQGAKGINYWDSDLKFKKNVQSIKSLKIKEDAPVTGLNLVNSIEHYTFDYKDGKHINVGYVSQQLETIDETLINKIEQPKDSPYWSEEDPYTRQPEVSTILPNVTLAIQEQQQIINAQSIEIEELKQKNEELEKRLKLIEEKLGL